MTPLFLKFILARSLRSTFFPLVALLVAIACGDATTEVPVETPVVTQVIVQPSTHVMPEGTTANYTARVLDQNGQELRGRQLTWTSSNTDIATVSSAGVVTSLTAGSTSISATADGRTGTGSLEVTRATVDRIDLSATTITIEEGERRTLTATPRDASGRILENRVVTWTSQDGSTITIDNTGTLTGLTAGTAQVIATVEGRTAAATVTVTRPSVATVTVSPNAFVIEIGEQRQMAAIVKDARGNVLTGRPIVWSVDGDAGSISPTGQLTGVRNGYLTIRATSEGKVGAVAATVVPAEASSAHLLYYRYTPGTGALELFTLEPGTGAPPTRINAGTVSRTPTASPAGSRVAFAVSMALPLTGERVDDIYAVDMNGLNMRRLTTMTGYDDSPAWSPTGNTIAFRHEDAQRSDVWVMGADGSSPMNLTADMPADRLRGEPAWSSDGTRIAFTERENGLAGTMAAIWIMNADGSGKRRITLTTNGFDASPTWAPSGDRLAFVRFYTGEADITIIDINSGAERRIRHLGLEGKPSWSPDGRMIAFTADTRNNIYTIAPDGTGLRLRTVDPAWGGGLSPVWFRQR